MKRIVAILLVLMMVVPMGLVAQAEDTSAEVKPFYLINWSPIPEGIEGDKVYNIYSLWTREPKEDTKELYVIAKDYSTGNNIPAIAASMKEVFDSRPVGTRYMMITDRLDANVEHRVFMDKGVNLLKTYLEKLYAEFKSIGGELDGLIIDMEYNENGAYYLDGYYQDDPFIYKKIVEDSRYQEKIRPKLVERGFKFWEKTTDYKPEIYSINEKAGAEYAQSREIWGVVMRELMCEYMEEACSPLFKYYPDANLSNYRYYASKSWIKSQDRRGGYNNAGNLDYVGNTTNENAYFYKPADVYFKEANGSALTFNYPISYNASHLQATKFNSFMWDVAVFKDMMMSSDTENMSVWVTGHNYTSDVSYSACDSPYYAETYLHIGMMNPMHFLGYVTSKMSEYADSVQILSDIMDELTRVAGAADRKYIKLPHNWNHGFAITGMYAGGRNIWRITPDLTGDMTLENFKVEGAEYPTFRINGQTVSFPGGKIVEDGNIRDVGTCGYWVETPTDVTPVVTSDANRYEMFPAFEENFDGYETGMEYTYNNVEFPTSWQIKKNKSATALIQEDKDNAGNKVLALTGDFTMKNAKVTKNITAGDTYAEDQTWEVTVTIPSDMGADAEAVLLAIYGDKFTPVDGGFKVAGGKLYYHHANDYVELEKVDVSAGGKFRLARKMDFNTEGAFTSDYIVYDAAGKELATVKDIPVAEKVEVPVEFIGFSVSKIAGNPVLLDNYKLYASGVSADFELYDAALGAKVAAADMDKARTADTAYRVSWMNATAYEKVYSVVAEYSNGETKVLKEIKMAPNTDAVETGVVEVAEGQSVRIYVRNDSQPEPEDEVTVPGDKEPVDTTEPTGEIFVVIVVIAGVVILLIVLAVVIVAVSKKKKATPAAEEKENESAE